jgi:serine-type D-Ala-D-Ala carboxypeptidase (penicillin-binding protein 5/6)
MNDIIGRKTATTRMTTQVPRVCRRLAIRHPLRCSIGILGVVDERNLAARAIAAVAIAAILFAGVPPHAFAKAVSSDLVDGTSAASRKIDVDALPDVTMKEGAVVDADGRILWARSPNARRPMASITKIMTAVLALEHSSPSDKVTVPREAVAVGESSAGLVAGEKLTMFELLEALLVKSGNDAAVTVAIDVAGSQTAFVEMMNQKAKDLGLSNTHYANPHGLDAPGHYTTAKDLSVLVRYAMSKPEFRDIVRRTKVTIGTGKRRTTLPSTDLLLGMYQGAIGVKTGNTNGAGYSVVSAAERHGVLLYAIVMGTSSDRQRFLDAKSLLDWGFAHYRPLQIADRGTVVAEASVTSYLDRSVPVEVSKDTTVAVLDLDGTIKRTVAVSAVPAPVKAGQQLGVATFRQGPRVVATVPLVATEDVGRPNVFEAVWTAIVRVWRRVF